MALSPFLFIIGSLPSPQNHSHRHAKSATGIRKVWERVRKLTLLTIKKDQLNVIKLTEMTFIEISLDNSREGLLHIRRKSLFFIVCIK